MQKNFRTLLASLFCGTVLLLSVCNDLATANSPLRLELRSRETADDNKQDTSRTVTKQVEWNPRATAIIVCDMWDDHTCKAAAARVAEMAPAMNATLKAARKQGVFIIHAPSGRTNFYKSTAHVNVPSLPR